MNQVADEIMINGTKRMHWMMGIHNCNTSIVFHFVKLKQRFVLLMSKKER